MEVLFAELLTNMTTGFRGDGRVLLCHSDDLGPCLDSLGFQDLTKRVVRPRHHGTSSLVVDAPITLRHFHHGLAVELWDEDRVAVVAEEFGVLADAHHER